ncbi:Ni/Fe hydrogenase subunit alpha [Patescibacteria group bacterium]|nr:Ni/Fe hydrogenase subunit alpha [Patescibacteria group bacterium]MBU1673075.1 Ni/Fe hydrogenase subunit alpha [Patescibacteria group bacterium]MBU1963681.1 Ni/Fe hydrogenase subunit alpha [Patescibacteria group bacterium]
MKVKINHIAKMEGHASFVGDIINDNMAEAKMKTEEGARLFEGLLIGRNYWEAPIITQRICGICPIVHTLSAIKAMEDCFGVKPHKDAIVLRKVMEHIQWIHSHALHLFFLSLPDFLEYENDLKMVGDYPKESQIALEVRGWSLKMLEIIGGRVVHQLTAEVGGFRKWPDQKKLEKLMDEYDDIMKKTLKFADIFKKLKYPKFERKTNYFCLVDPKEYGIYTGKVKNDFFKKIKEVEKPGELVKRVLYMDEPFFCGALARVNINYTKLNPQAKKYWNSYKIKLPTYNLFYNVPAQATEVIHSMEEIKKLLPPLLKRGIKNRNVSYKTKSGKAFGAVEAPRGTLYDFYELDKNGKITNCNIITPTAQFLANLEADLEVYLLKTKKLTKKQRQQKIRTLIRAYDPCISCATH